MPDYKPPVDAFYSEVQIPIYINPFRIMGRGGSNLIYITEKSGCQYIWIDLKRRVVEIWGREDSLPNAISRIRRMIHSIVAKTLTVPDEYFELPNATRDALSVYSWRKTGLIMYEIAGPDKLCTDFFSLLEKKYPYNPYMTCVSRKTAGGLIVSRLASST